MLQHQQCLMGAGGLWHTWAGIYWHLSAPTSHISILESCGSLVLGEADFKVLAESFALLKHECNIQGYCDISLVLFPSPKKQAGLCALSCPHAAARVAPVFPVAKKSCKLLCSSLCSLQSCTCIPLSQDLSTVNWSQEWDGFCSGMGKSSGFSRWLCCS